MSTAICLEHFDRIAPAQLSVRNHETCRCISILMFGERPGFAKAARFEVWQDLKESLDPSLETCKNSKGVGCSCLLTSILGPARIPDSNGPTSSPQQRVIMFFCGLQFLHLESTLRHLNEQKVVRIHFTARSLALWRPTVHRPIPNLFF